MSGARPSPRPLSRRRILFLLSLVFLLIGVVLFAEGMRRYLDRGSPAGIAASQCGPLREHHHAWERCLSHYESRSPRDVALDVLPGFVSATILGTGALVLMVLTPRREEESGRVPRGA